MIVSSDDLLDWIADRRALLIAAWTPQIAVTLAWDGAFAEALAAELHDAMLSTMLRKGTEKEFFGLVARSNTGIDQRDAKAIADRFFGVTLTLARAASRYARENKTALVRFKYGVVVGDSRSDPAHLPLAQVLLPQHHKFWATWHPPFGLDCRCSTNLMSQSQLDRSGRTLTSEGELAWIEAQLVDAWPIEFRPLLDFRMPPARMIEQKAVAPLTSHQLNDILAMLKDSG